MIDEIVLEGLPSDGSGAQPLRRLESRDPASGRLLGEVPLLGVEGIEAAIRAAREAQPRWAARPPVERAAVLRRFGERLVDELEAVARLITLEQGKPEVEALSIELLPTLGHLRWLARDGVRALEPRRQTISHPFFTSKQGQTIRVPLGVVAIITPWNYPFSLPAIQAMTALLAGNAVILKPSPEVPLSAQKVVELARQAGLPAGLLNVIHVEDAVAPHLTSHPDIDKIIFTGSVETGRAVMRSAAAGPTPVVLELGGNDAAIVAADAPLDRAVEGILWYALANAGQSCAGVERVYVEAEIYDAFVARLVERARTLTVGEGRDPATEIGTLTSERQLAIVERQVAEALERGARALIGGHRLERPGCFYAPTVLVDVTPEMAIMREESFGPVIPIARVPTLEAAIDAANATGYGLSVSLWTADQRRALALAPRLKAGAININDHAYHFAEPNAPWGGIGESGFGRTHGEAGLAEMVSERFVSVDARREAEPWWFPYDPGLARFLKSAARLLYGAPSRRPWAALSLILSPDLLRRLPLGRALAAILRR